MERLVRLYKEHFFEEPLSVVPITGSASNRQYFRLAGQGNSCVGVIGVDRAENNAFIYFANHFRKKGIAVPEIYAVSDDDSAYIEQDLGDVVLYEILDSSGVDDMLCKAVAALPSIQFEGANGLDFGQCFTVSRFDRRLVMFDLNYFKYCFLKPSGLEFNEALLQDDFDRFADDLLEGPETNTFLFRDFNSRNVMVCDGSPYFIDFQGGMQGPIYYDVASFIWHARSGYTDSQKEMMLSAYIKALHEYMEVDEFFFRAKLRKFVLFRMLQVMGAYGFRGLVEQKSKFITGIPAVMQELKRILESPFEEYPYLMQMLERLVVLPKFAVPTVSDGVLEVRVSSFSFRKGIPQDMTGNGGGYVFDCRSIHNPGRYAPYKKLTGRDEPVIRFLEEDGEVFRYLEHVYGVVDPHVETFSERGFTSLMVSFGCTGGQHRSVYCAENLARHLAEKYPHIRVSLTHREQPSIPPITKL